MIGGTSIVDTIVNPLRFDGGQVDGFISSRLMAAYDLDGGHRISVALDSVQNGRLFWHFILELSGTVIFEGTDLSTVITSTYGDVARTALDFLTGEVPAWFTPEQEAWHAEHAEFLRIFSLDPEEDPT